MKFGKTALERIALAFERIIEKGLTTVLRDCEIHVSVVIKPQKEPSNGQTASTTE
jgi:hypothetical protein